MALAKQLKLSITDVKLQLKKYVLSLKLAEEYIKTYTIDPPDTFMFANHEKRTIPINPGANPIQQEIAWDVVLDAIWVTLENVSKVGGLPPPGSPALHAYDFEDKYVRSFKDKLEICKGSPPLPGILRRYCALCSPVIWDFSWMREEEMHIPLLSFAIGSYAQKRKDVCEPSC